LDLGLKIGSVSNGLGRLSVEKRSVDEGLFLEEFTENLLLGFSLHAD